MDEDALPSTHLIMRFHLEHSLNFNMMIDPPPQFVCLIMHLKQVIFAHSLVMVADLLWCRLLEYRSRQQWQLLEMYRWTCHSAESFVLRTFNINPIYESLQNRVTDPEKCLKSIHRFLERRNHWRG